MNIFSHWKNKKWFVAYILRKCFSLNKILQKLKNFISLIINKHHIIVHYIIVLITVIVITTLFPRQNFSYDFELNKPWKYENLYASFTFPIKKSQDSIKAEEERLLSLLPPFYVHKKDIKKEVKDKFTHLFAITYHTWQQDSLLSLSKTDSAYYIETIFSVIDTIYNKGVLELDDEHKVGQQNIKHLNLMEEGTVSAKKTNINNYFLDVKEACKYAYSYIRTLPDSSFSSIAGTLCNSLEPNILYDRSQTRKIIKTATNNIIHTEGSIQRGELIIAQGALVKAKEFQILESLRNVYENSEQNENSPDFLSEYYTDFGFLLITFIVIGMFVLFLQIFEKEVFMNIRKMIFILVAITSFLALISLLVSLQQTGKVSVSLYGVSFCIIPIVIKSFFGHRIAGYTHIVIMLLTGFIVPVGFEFLFLHFVAGFVAIIISEKTHYWSHFFLAIGVIFLTYSIGYLGISLVQESAWSNIKFSNFGWLFVNAIFTLLAYPLIPVFEKLFGFVSDITLVELSDLNKPLLRDLAKTAPGTFWHSLQVANLAENAASEIGAKALLAKVGALYHDIGKMQRPAYFMENQRTAINPHDDLPYIESARIIKAHVISGIEMAKKERLPNILIDFIRTHHGTTRIEYFYRQYIDANPDQNVDERLFCYAGPLPYSKETAVVMMADSIEAASRSLKNPTDEFINNLVDNIIQGKISQNQFENCDISFKDLTIIKKSFKKQLRSIYHIRISYPEVRVKKTTP